MSHRHHGPSTSRNVVSIIFSFFLSITLVAEALVLVVHVGVFTDMAFLTVLDDAYFRYTLETIESEAKTYTMPTGIDPSVLEGVFGVEEIKGAVTESVRATYKGNTYTPSVVGPTERLDANVRAYLSQGGNISAQDIDAITTAYVEDIMNIYRTNLQLPGLSVLAPLRVRYSQYTLIGAVVLAAIALGLTVALTRLHHYRHRGLRYVAYATGGAALMCFIVPFVFFQSKYYLGINLAPQYFYHFAVSLIEHLLRMCFIAAGVYLVLTIVVIVLVYRKRAHIIKSRRPKNSLSEWETA